MGRDPSTCPVCTGTALVLLAVTHPAARKLTVELLEREHGCWHVRALEDPRELARAIADAVPDLVVVDTADVALCCRDLLAGMPPDRIVVVGPEPDDAYARAARRAGAGAWLARDRIADDLSATMRLALGCTGGAGCPRT